MNNNEKVLCEKPIIKISAVATITGVGLVLSAEQSAINFFKLDEEKVAELGKPLMDYIEECEKALHENKKQNAEESVEKKLEAERKESIDEMEKLFAELKVISEAMADPKKKEDVEKLGKILEIAKTLV